MGGFIDFDEIWKGYSKEDEFIARDIVITNLLISKGVLTQEEVNQAYEKLPDIVQEVKKIRDKAIEEKYNELMDKYKREEKEEDDSSK